MQDSPIQIGSISLHSFEVPESIRFGGRQRMVIHHLAGGGRLVERLGPDDAEIIFEGTFTGPSAESRVREFDNLRLSGTVVWLTWETFRRRVVVESLVVDYHSPWWIRYKISCVVAHQSGVEAAASTILSSISTDLGNALTAVSGSGLSLSTVQAALFTPNAMTIGTSSQSQASSAIATVLQTINSQITLQSALVTIPLGPYAGAESYSQNLNSAVISAGLLAGAVNARSYIGRIGVNIDVPNC